MECAFNVLRASVFAYRKIGAQIRDVWGLNKPFLYNFAANICVQNTNNNNMVFFSEAISATLDLVLQHNRATNGKKSLSYHPLRRYNSCLLSCVLF